LEPSSSAGKLKSAAALAADRSARQSYGRLLAILAATTRDIALAEDFLGTAFASAIETWSARGVPDNPEAWLLKAARNRFFNHHHQARHRAEAVTHLVLKSEELAAENVEATDRRLALLFVCAHPAIEAAVRAPLMLQTVLGLDAATIAPAFLVSDTAMSQRLVRAKARIKGTGMRFCEPEDHELPDRLPDVLEAIYAAFGFGWDGPQSLEAEGLPAEAIFLARTLAELLPNQPEALGLLSLLLHVHARRNARRRRDGGFVPLDQQDPADWDRDMIVEAERLLVLAARHGRFGRFQCEAAIQSVHAQAGLTGRLNREALDTLYGLLVETHPTVGAMVAHASVKRELHGAERALELLERLPDAARARYQPAQVVLALCLRDVGDVDGARLAAERALELTSDASVRTHLRSMLLDPATTRLRHRKTH
jgi:RNA polymerase sigma-70 factor, ECF subfamily